MLMLVLILISMIILVFILILRNAISYLFCSFFYIIFNVANSWGPFNMKLEKMTWNWLLDYLGPMIAILIQSHPIPSRWLQWIEMNLDEVRQKDWEWICMEGGGGGGRRGGPTALWTMFKNAELLILMLILILIMMLMLIVDVHILHWLIFSMLVSAVPLARAMGRTKVGPNVLKRNVWNDHIFLALKVYSGVGIDIRQRVLLKDVKEKV